jgi:hypothetical protein
MDMARHRVALGRPVPDPSRRWAPDAAMGALSLSAPDFVPIPFDVHAPKRVLVVHHTTLTAEVQSDLQEVGYWLQGGPYWLVFVRHVPVADGQTQEQACGVYAGDLHPPILRRLADGGFSVTDAAPYTIWAINTEPAETAPTDTASTEEQETER